MTIVLKILLISFATGFLMVAALVLGRLTGHRIAERDRARRELRAEIEKHERERV